MVKKTKQSGFDPRDLWLAGLGAVSLTRKQATKAFDVLVAEGTQFREATSARLTSLKTQARDGLDGVVGRVGATVEPLVSRATQTYGAVVGSLESRLSSVGKKRAPTRRQTAARKAAATRSARSTVKKAESTVRRAVKKAV